MLRLHHVAIQVTDLVTARHFYVSALGFEVTREQPHSLWLEAGGVILMLELCSGLVDDGAWSSARPGPHGVAFSIAASERDTWLQRLHAHAVVVDHESKFSIYFRDPFGARLALSHYPDA